MGIFDKFIGRSVKLQEASTELTAFRNVNEQLMESNLALRESASIAQLRLEDYMWSPIDGWRTDNGFDITTIKKEADICRQLFAVNPLIKKAVTARVGMVHGRGSKVIAGKNEKQDTIDAEVEKNARRIFGSVAKARLEAELSVAGNVFVMRQGKDTTIVVPIEQITGYVSEVDDPTNVLYWKRNYSAQETNIQTGQETTKIVTEYIPAHGVRTPHNTIGEVPVRKSARMFHIASNRQEGWILGLPDLFAAKFWTKGHKEMFEAGHEFALAQGNVAAKVVATSGAGGQQAASRLADMPTRDPETGEIYGFGSTVVMGGGMDYQLMGRMGAGVDFKSYDRIAGLIAAATGVPLAVILAESGDEEVSLEQSVVDDMKLRQDLWTEFYEDFLFPHKVQISWPRIKQESLYRTQQAIEIANRTNTLSAEVKRQLALEAFGVEGDPQDTPDIMEHPDVQVYLAKKQIDLEYAPLIAEAEGKESTDVGSDDRSTTPDQGNDQKIGKLSDGKDAHDARDAGEQEHTR